ncbi:MAG: SDR family oxidoreductase [Deltaproteobacteria bacterium]|nr:SDR family oxidoreductase [Deltaproteobacteria bacterium]
MDLKLNDKVVLITGSSKGIGKAIAEEFATEGARISICARGRQDLEIAADAIRGRGASVIATPADVNLAEDVKRTINATMEAFGRIDVLVNNAGDIVVGRSITATDEQWRDTLEVNLLSAVRFSRSVVPIMRKQSGGRIINISSCFARTVPMTGAIDYWAAKAALLSFSRTLATEVAADNILVNSVCPGFTESPMLDRIYNQAMPILEVSRREDVAEAFQRFLLIKRMGQAEEVAALVTFLASGRASYITGSVFDVDGGFLKSI